MPQSDKLCVVFLIMAETSVRDFIERILHEHGAVVFSASNPHSALHVLKAYGGEVHLVIVDRRIPGGDGLALAERIVGDRPRARVVLLTDTGTEGVPKVWQDRLLSAPLDAEALRRHVETALHAAPCEAIPMALAMEAGQ